MHLFFKFFFILMTNAVFCSVYGQSIVSSTSPTLSKLKSKHFEVVFEERQRDVAQQFLISAEKARFLLSPYFKQLPDKITIVVEDSTDLANGFATFFPYPVIQVYPVLPEEGSVLSNYESWSDLLMLHEYVHSLQLYPANGFYKPIQFIFGSIIHPNGLLPTWMLEGVATDFESRLTQHGRLRSKIYNARLRAMIRDSSLNAESIDRINESGVPSYPFGERPYFFGALLSNEVSNSGSSKDWGDLFYSYSRNIPYTFLNTNVKDKIGKEFAELLESSYKKYEEVVRQQLKVERQKTVAIDAPGDLHFNPAASPDGKWFVYTEQQLKFGFSLRIAPVEESGSISFSKSKRLKKVFQPVRVHWSQTSSKFLFETTDVFKRIYQVKDIYEFDLEKWQSPQQTKKAIKKLSSGQRLHSPIYVGEDIYAIRNHRNFVNEVVKYEKENKKVTKFYASKPNQRLSSLAFDQAENSLLFVKRDVSGAHHLQRYSLLTRSAETIEVKWNDQLLTDLSDLKIMADGQTLFASEVNGTKNFFKANQGFKSVTPISNTQTYVQGATLLNGKLILSELYGSGFKLTQAQELPKSFEQHPRVIELKNEVEKKETETFEAEDLELKDANYSALPYLVPRYWIPMVYSVQGGWLLQAMTSASDPFARHNYSLLGEHDTYTQKSGYSFTYAHATRLSTIGIYSRLSNTPISFSSTDTIVNDIKGVQASFFFSESDTYPAIIGFNRHFVEYAGDSDYSRQGLFYGLGYNSSFKSPGDDSLRENLFSTSATHQNYLRAESYFSYNQYALDVHLQWSSFLPLSHFINWGIRGEFAPDLDFSLTPIFGQTTVGGNYYQSLIQSPLMMRGYPTAVFRGRHMVNSNLEYTFDLIEHYRGLKYVPLFFKKTRMNLFLDALTMDGYFENTGGDLVVSKDYSDTFLGSGVELIFDATLGNQFPVSVIAGLYYGHDQRAYGGLSPFFGFLVGDLTKTSSENHR